MIIYFILSCGIYVDVAYIFAKCLVIPAQLSHLNSWPNCKLKLWTKAMRQCDTSGTRARAGWRCVCGNQCGSSARCRTQHLDRFTFVRAPCLLPLLHTFPKVGVCLSDNSLFWSPPNPPPPPPPDPHTRADTTPLWPQAAVLTLLDTWMIKKNDAKETEH